MKLVTYQCSGSAARAGAVIHDGTDIVDLAAASALRGWDQAPYANVLAMIEAGDAALAQAYDLLTAPPGAVVAAVADCVLHAPLQPPVQMRDCLCFEGHLKQSYRNMREMRAQRSPDPAAAMAEMERDGILTIPKVFYEQPIYYKANRFAVVGTGHDVIWPRYSEVMDFELEFGIYIGKRALDVAAGQARPYIYGYTIFNDMSARDAQWAEMGGQLGPAKGKDFDTSNPMGPALVTADELTDPYNLTMTARVNGEEWTRGKTNTMHWNFEDLIAHISRSETLYPGEFLGSGTIEGGCGIEHMRFLQPGDVVELEVEGLGVLRNRLVRPDHRGGRV